MNPIYKNRNFVQYLFLRFGIIFALHMQYTVISFKLFQLTQDNLTIGMMNLWEVIAAVGSGFLAGEFVDRMRKLAVLRGSVFLFLIVSIGFLILNMNNRFQSIGEENVKYWVYVSMFLIGIGRAFGGPSTFSLLSIIVHRDNYNKAIPSSTAAWQLGAVLGPLTGGLLLAYTDALTVEIIVVILLLAVLIVTWSMHVNEVLDNTSQTSIIENLKVGFRFVFSKEIIWGVITLDLFAVLFGGAEALLPDFADNILHVGEVGYGWLKSAHGIGSIIMVSILSRYPLRTRPGQKLLWSIAGFGLCMIGFGLSPYFFLSFGFLLTAGMLDAVSVIMRQSILQIYTPDNMKGRVSAISSMFINSSNELGGFESGVTARWLGTIPAVVLGGSMTIVVAAVMNKLAPKIRQIELS